MIVLLYRTQWLVWTTAEAANIKLFLHACNGTGGAFITLPFVARRSHSCLERSRFGSGRSC